MFKHNVITYIPTWAGNDAHTIWEKTHRSDDIRDRWNYEKQLAQIPIPSLKSMNVQLYCAAVIVRWPDMSERDLS